MKVKKTKKKNSKVKMLCYAPAGYGKTLLCSTAPRPLIISAEAGLLSLPDGIDYIEIKTIKDIHSVLDLLAKEKARKAFETVCVDSITDIAETYLAEIKPDHRNLMQAYGLLADDMMTLTRRFRDLKGYHIYMTAKAKRVVDEAGNEKFYPSMPGQQLVTNLPYLFDEVLPIRIAKKGGERYRYFQGQPSKGYEAKDRSGRLSKKEPLDLGRLFNKILNKEE